MELLLGEPVYVDRLLGALNEVIALLRENEFFSHSLDRPAIYYDFSFRDKGLKGLEDYNIGNKEINSYYNQTGIS